jgi:hypothetical protein
MVALASFIGSRSSCFGVKFLCLACLWHGSRDTYQIQKYKKSRQERRVVELDQILKLLRMRWTRNVW